MADQFNNTIRELFRIFKDLPVKTFKGKIHIKEMQRKMVTGMKTEPNYAMHVLGQYLWQARVEIAARNAEFFLTKRYEVELMRLCSQHSINYDDAINTVNFMKDAYQNANTDMQVQIMNSIIELLKIISQQELNKR